MEVKVTTTTVTEAVTAAEIKDILGYPDDDQDTRIARLITVARMWLEARTGVSAIAKEYKVQFDKGDRDGEGFYELPFSPVVTMPDTVCVSGSDVTYDQSGLERKRVRPSSSFGTVPVGGTPVFYLEVTFTAGASHPVMDECIRRIAVTMFNDPQDSGSVSIARLSYDTLRMIESINQNTGF